MLHLSRKYINQTTRIQCSRHGVEYESHKVLCVIFKGSNWVELASLSVFRFTRMEKYAQCDPCPDGEFRSWSPGGTCEG